MKTFKQYISEEKLTPQPGTQLGSNPGGIHTSESGEKFYVKHPQNIDQGRVEAITGQIYHHMGIHTTGTTIQDVNGKEGVVSKWNEHLRPMGTSDFRELTPEQANHMGRIFHAAVLTKNWDVVGTGIDHGEGNLMLHKQTGQIYSIDHGGSFHFRARGASKDYGDDIGEVHSLKQNSDAGRVFSHVFKQHPNAEKDGLQAVHNMDMDHVHSVFKNSGLSNWQDLHSNFVKRRQKLIDHYS